MGKIRSILLIALAISLVGGSFLGAQPVPGSIVVDVSNRIFDDRDQAATEFSRRLGAQRLDIFINNEEYASASLNADQLNIEKHAHGYTQVEIDLEGRVLKNLTVKAVDANTFAKDAGKKDGYAGRQNYEKAIDKLNMFSGVQGYKAFKDIQKFKVFANDSSSKPDSIGLGISYGPAEMLSPEVSSSKTSLFRERKLKAGELEVLPSWVENPWGMTFDIYLCYSNYTKLSDIKSGTDKWTSAWKYDEVVTKGKKIGGQLYTMSKVNSQPLEAVYPMGDDFRSYLLTGMDSTNYCYIAIVAHFGNASAVSSVKEIQVP